MTTARIQTTSRRTLRSRFAAILLALSAALFAAPAPSYPPAPCRIVVAPDAIPAEKTAAKELSSGLGRIFRLEFPIVEAGEPKEGDILVGQSPAAARLLGGVDFGALRPDEIILKTVGTHLVLAGQRPRGSLYAVNEYLERYLGVRFWTADVETWPSRETFALPAADHRYAPVLHTRDVYYDVIKVKGPRFTVRCRSNGTWSNAAAPEWGGTNTIIGSVHTFHSFIPPAKYFATHPEWFGEQGGRRQKTAQLCLSNPEVRRKLAEEALIRLRQSQNPYKAVAISQNDHQTPCECRECAAFVKKNGNQTDLLIFAVNDVARMVAKEFPDAVIHTLAYLYTRFPPKTQRPARNVRVQLCSIDVDFSAPLDSAVNERFRKLVNGWEPLVEELNAWNYITNYTKPYLPHPNWRFLAPDIRYLVKHKVRYLMDQGSLYGSIADLADLRAWVVAKLMWDPSLDPQALIQEFAEGYYGPAAPAVLHYIQVASDRLPQGSGLSCHNGSAYFLSDDDLLEIHRRFLDAEKRIAASPALRQRLLVAALPVRMAMAESPTLWKRPDTKGMDLDAFFAQLKPILIRHSRSFNAARAEMVFRQILFLHGRHRGPEPAVAKGRKWYEWIPSDGAQTCQYSTVLDDPDGVSGKVLRIPCTSVMWLVQVKAFPKGDIEVYAEMRCDNKVPGNAAQVGIYDPARHSEAARKVSAAELAGEKYRTVLIRRVQNKGPLNVYITPQVNAPAGNIWIRRILFVENPPAKP